MSATRPQDWPAKLASFLAARDRTPFKWGEHDCVHFAAAWLLSLGYTDPLSGFAPWTGPLSAARAIRERDGFQQAVAHRLAALGCEVIPPLLARRGDIVLSWIDDRRQALGIAVGSHVACPGTDRLMHLPIKPHAIAAWSV